jgi:hypothetical protein
VKEIVTKYTLTSTLILKEISIIKGARLGMKQTKKFFKYNLKYLSQTKSENWILCKYKLN